ncbi:uncharacterized protein [Haliotis asinina]|uniref:uncharacterized protein n=1 Tax=Haliotis asinina TaxID=109174 RepID=UPI00353190D2
MKPSIHCLYGNCKYTDKTAGSDNITFVPFPKPLTQRIRKRVRKWLDACGRCDVSVSFVEKNFNKCYLCATHFVGGDGPTKLRPDPICFQIEEPSEDTDSSEEAHMYEDLSDRNAKVCCVDHCGSLSSRDWLTTFYPIPQDDDQLQQRWRDALRLGTGFLADNLYVCSKHFISGLKSNFSAHPDYVPSILPSSTVHDIKALRNTLREFENGSAEKTMKSNFKSLKRHWLECGFTSEDLQLGMERVKALKRAQEHAKHQEQQVLKAVRLKRKFGNKINVGSGLQEIKQEQDSEFVQRDGEFVIENERAEESEEDSHDFDLSVKQEPMSESSVDIKTEDNQNGLTWSDSGSLCLQEEEDMESSCSKGQGFCSEEKVEQGSFSENDTCPFTVVRTDGKVMMSEKGIKTELEDDEYEKAVAPAVNKNRQDFCDEICVNSGGPEERHQNLGTIFPSTDFECPNNDKENNTNWIHKNGCDFEALSVSLDQRQRCSNSEVGKTSHISNGHTADMLNRTQDVGEQEGLGPEVNTLAQAQEDNSSAAGHASVCDPQASFRCGTPVGTEANPDPLVDETFTLSDSSSAPPELEDPNSKMCQTEKGISKEYTFEKALKQMKIQLTPSEMKSLLKEELGARGICPSFQRKGRVIVNAGVQSSTDELVLHDLNMQCVRLNRELTQHRKKLKSLTYDFLDKGSKVTKGNVLHHTGCYTFASLVELYQYVSVCLETPPLDDISDSQEFILTLMKLRLGLHNYDLAFRFQIDPTSVPRILNKWISIFFNTLSPLIMWPESEPERTEYRNQRWRLLKLRYFLLMAYDGIDSMKEDWLIEQNVDEIIKICDVLNSFIVLEKTMSRYVPILPETSPFFIERTKPIAVVVNHSTIEKKQETQPSETNEENVNKTEQKYTESQDKHIDEENKSKTDDIEEHVDCIQTQNRNISKFTKDIPQSVGDDVDKDLELQTICQEILQQDSTESSKYACQKEVDILRDVQLEGLGKESRCKIMTSVRVITKGRGIMIGPPMEEVEVGTTPSQERATLLDLKKVFSIIADDESECMD